MRMIKLDIGKAAGAADFDVKALDFVELLATDVTKADLDKIKIGKKEEVVVSLGVVDSNTSFKIYGSFNVDAFDNKNPNKIEDTVKEINKIVVYEGKAEVLTLSGLKLKAADLADADALQAYIAKQNFSLEGNDRDNTLGGSDRNDTISGAGGKDTLTGHGGRDELTGGKNADTFVFAQGDGADVITDFRAKGVEQDHIDLTAYDITFDQITISPISRKSFEISFDNGTDTIVLQGPELKLKDIDVTDFLF
jgi:hypothetical protein